MIVCLVELTLLVGSPVGSSGAASPAVPGPGQTFRVVRNEFVAPDGRQFVPYGFVLYCLALTSLSCEHPTTEDPNTDFDRIWAASRYWHANTVRIQVAPQNLFGSAPYDASNLKILDEEVKLANRLGMVAIVTLQTEEFDGPPLPTRSALRFWGFMARHFRSNPMVFFDLYNEPRLTPRLGEEWMWNLWRNGGTAEVKGKEETFVGMQELVDRIRATGAENIIIAEGNQGDHDLSELPRFLLTGSNVGYGIEPDLTPSDDAPDQWAANWGNQASSVPISMEAFQDYPAAEVCNSESPTLLPELLDYLHDKRLGLIVYSLQRGDLVVGQNLEDPTTFSGVSAYPCTDAASAVGAAPKKRHDRHHHHHGGQNDFGGATVGPGSVILAFFRANSSPVSAGAIPMPTPKEAGGPSLWLIALVVLVAVVALLSLFRFIARRRRA